MKAFYADLINGNTSVPLEEAGDQECRVVENWTAKDVISDLHGLTDPCVYIVNGETYDEVDRIFGIKKPHGNTGKQNALKGDKPLTAQIVVRCPADLKSRAEKAASDSGISASQLYVSAIERYLAT